MIKTPKESRILIKDVDKLQKKINNLKDKINDLENQQKQLLEESIVSCPHCKTEHRTNTLLLESEGISSYYDEGRTLHNHGYIDCPKCHKVFYVCNSYSKEIGQYNMKQFLFKEHVEITRDTYNKIRLF